MILFTEKPTGCNTVRFSLNYYKLLSGYLKPVLISLQMLPYVRKKDVSLLLRHAFSLIVGRFVTLFQIFTT